MTRAAIYARYSTDLQSDASIEDQIRICKERATANGWQVVNCYTDHATSGASMMRPGIQMLMLDAQSGKFDIVLAEALDRLSRDQEDIAGIYKRLQFAGAGIHTLSEGEVSNLHIGLKGTMNALFLKDLADKTRRGVRGRVEQGKAGGGLTFGYDVIRRLDAGGEPVTGERRINPEQAAIVKRIFQEYLAGRSPKAIAAKLNKDGIAGPSGKAWGPTTSYGNRARGTGILNNELYIGRMVWNRLRYIKDPETGKRVSRPNPESEWVIREVPELRIVDDETWQAAKDKQGVYVKREQPFWAHQRPRNLFSYLIKCGQCGGGCSMVSKTHLGCSSARNKGTCGNRLTIAREKLEESVLGALRTHLMDEELCKEFCEEYTRHMIRVRKEHNGALARYKTELAKLERERQKLVQSIKDGVPGSVLKDDAIRIDTRMRELNEIVENTEEAPLLFQPRMAERYQKEVQDLIAALNDPERRPEATELVRGLVEKIVLMPVANTNRLAIDLYGDLAGILSIATKDGKGAANGKKRGQHSAPGDEDIKQVKMVAGAGFDWSRLAHIEGLMPVNSLLRLIAYRCRLPSPKRSLGSAQVGRQASFRMCAGSKPDGRNPA